MLAQPQLPEFATAPWYSDPSDHRCPHDAWLEALAISEPAEGERKEQRQTAITVRLLGAYHDGHIVFRYHRVKKHSIVSSSCERGLGDWLQDEFSHSSAGLVVHRITWAGFGPEEQSHWSIEAGISYEWIPKRTNQTPEPTTPSRRG
jgi:hypothetical protein